MPVYVTPAGKLGVLVCFYSWYPDAYESLPIQGVELPSFISHLGAWDQP